MEENQNSFLEYELIVGKIKELFAIFNEQLKKNIQVALLIGNTGCGKSTLFNFLAGFEFTIKKENRRQYIELKNPNQLGASLMKGGLTSVTKEPNYYYNKDNNYLLIDFPGFNDTKGPFQKAFIEILFNQLVKKLPLKVIHVTELSNDQFPNRGQDLQNFINQSLGCTNQDIGRLTLFCNHCSAENCDEEQIKTLRDELKVVYKQDFKNIALIQKMKSDEDIQTKLDLEKRRNLWEMIEKSEPIQLKPVLFQYVNEIVGQINIKSIQIIQNIMKLVSESLKKKLKSLNKKDIETLLCCFLQINMLIDYQINQDAFVWYSELINQCIKIQKLLGQNYNQEGENKAFIKVFEFLSQQIEIIIPFSIELIKDQMITLKKIILSQLVELDKKELHTDQNQDNNNQNQNDVNQNFSSTVILELLRNQQILLDHTYNRQQTNRQHQQRDENFFEIQEEQKQIYYIIQDEKRREQQQKQQQKERKQDQCFVF